MRASEPRSPGRPCSICSHADRQDIDAELIAGTSVTRISRRFAVSTDALYRHLRSHVSPAARDALRGPAALPASDFARRVLDVADHAREMRLTAMNSGRRTEAVKASDSELKALGILLDRLGISDSEIVAELDQSHAMLRALGRVLRRQPDLADELSRELSEDGQRELAADLESVANQVRTERADLEVSR